jgi:putative sterol carrier protein
MDDQGIDSRDGEPSEPIAKTAPARRSRWLEGVHGTLRFLVRQTAVATLTVDDGEVRTAKGDGPADTTIICRSEDDVDRLIRGELNPVIVGLLGRLEIEGDVALGIQVLQSLRDATVAPARET